MTTGRKTKAVAFDMVAHIQDTYRAINSESIRAGILAELYTEDAEFVDPFHHLRGRSQLETYFSRLYRNLNSIEFQYRKTVVSDHDIFMEWCMTISHPRLDKGRPVRVEGTSRFEVQDRRIRMHRDYFDGGELLYEHLPLLGRIIRMIKGRMGR